MFNAYYRLQYKSELEYFREELQGSNCRGFYVPYHFFENNETRDALKESLSILGKEIVLYNDFYKEFRPTLIADSDLRRFVSKSDDPSSWESIIEKKKLGLEKLRFLTDNPNNAMDYVNNQYSIYLDTKEFLENLQNRNELELFFFDFIQDPIEIKEFEFPYVPTFPLNSKVKHKDLEEIYNRTQLLNELFFNIQKEERKFKDCIFNITLSLPDLEKESSVYHDMIKRTTYFSNVSLWIIEFNEIYATRSQIMKVCDLVQQLSQSKNFFVCKFIGIFSNRMLRRYGSKLHSTIRLNGYPGQNLNLMTRIARTRKLVDPRSGSYLSIANIGEKFKEDYHCNCNICLDNEIYDYTAASEFYLSPNPEDSPYYRHLIGRAVKTKHKKIRNIQNRNIQSHCLANLEENLNLNQPDFYTKFKNAKNFDTWKKIYLDVNNRE